MSTEERVLLWEVVVGEVRDSVPEPNAAFNSIDEDWTRRYSAIGWQIDEVFRMAAEMCAFPSRALLANEQILVLLEGDALSNATMKELIVELEWLMSVRHSLRMNRSVKAYRDPTRYSHGSDVVFVAGPELPPHPFFEFSLDTHTDVPCYEPTEVLSYCQDVMRRCAQALAQSA